MKKQKVQRHFKIGKVYKSHGPLQHTYVKLRDSHGWFGILRVYRLCNDYDVVPNIVWFENEESVDQLMVTMIAYPVRHMWQNESLKFV